MAWNRSQGGGAPAGVWWFDTPQPPSQANAGPPSGLAALPLALRDGRHPWLAQGGALPAVPEPATYLLWLAGLGLLALAARRQNGISGGKGRPAARR
ncbi:PEP-CTERM sorting domain-containing protein [Duganella sp. HSC-15S17]|nr:PEP-CTERM sorting domain-containing protein [Duganella violaceicalia]